MKRRKLILFSLLAAFIMLIYGISYAVSPTRQARIATEEELPKLKELVGDRYQDFHFASREELAKAYLGEPIPSYKIHNFDANKSIVEQMKKSDFYVFPVIVDGKAATDIPVVLENQEWKVVDIGGHLSRVIQNVKLNHKLTEIKVLKFYEATFVLGKKGNKLVGFLPYRGSRELGIEKGELIKIEKIEKLIENQKKDVETRQQKYEETGEIQYGSSEKL